ELDRPAEPALDELVLRSADHPDRDLGLRVVEAAAEVRAGPVDDVDDRARLDEDLGLDHHLSKKEEVMAAARNPETNGRTGRRGGHGGPMIPAKDPEVIPFGL